MAEQMTIEVSELVARRAALAAERSRRPVADILSDWLEWAASEVPVELLPDEDVLALAEAQLPEEEQERLGLLLARSREDTLDAPGRRELDGLMRTYERGLLRKAQALRVAVERGIREPLSLAIRHPG